MRQSRWTLVGVQDEAREGAVLVVVAPVSLSSIQLHVDLVSRVQVQHSTVAGVVVVLVRVLSDGTGPDLQGGRRQRQLLEPHQAETRSRAAHRLGSVKVLRAARSLCVKRTGRS